MNSAKFVGNVIVPNIAWKDSLWQRHYKEKGPNASLDIRQYLNKSQGILVSIDEILLAERRKHLPPGKGYRRPGETTLFNTQPFNLSLDTLIPTVLQLRLFRPTIYALIDTGCLHTNIISTGTRWWTDI